MFFALVALSRVIHAEPGLDAVLFCPQLDSAIRIDGMLDESVWKESPVLYLGRMGNLSPLLPARVRLFWNAHGLHVGFEVEDIDIRGQLADRDGLLWRDGDVVEFFLSPGKGEVARYEVQVNPRGALLDIAWRPERGFDECKAWNWPGMEWKARHEGSLNDAAGDRSWTVEMALPWKPLVEAGAPPPAPGVACFMLCYVMNHVALADGRMPRESTYWPIVSQETTSDVSQYGRLFLAGPDAADMPVNGFAEVIEGAFTTGDIYRRDYRGMTAAWGMKVAGGVETLKWRTQPIPLHPPGRVSFLFVATSFGAKGPAPDQFGLYLGGEKLLSFDPHRPESHTWEEGDARLAFHHRAGSAHSCGVLELTVPGARVEPGAPAVLEIRRESEKKTCSLALSAWTDAARFEYYASRMADPAR